MRFGHFIGALMLATASVPASALTLTTQVFTGFVGENYTQLASIDMVGPTSNISIKVEFDKPIFSTVESFYSFWWAEYDADGNMTSNGDDYMVYGPLVDYHESSYYFSYSFNGKPYYNGPLSPNAAYLVQYNRPGAIWIRAVSPDSPTAYKISVSTWTDVPEPATWALLIAGFGLVGGALRSRKRATVTYA